MAAGGAGQAIDAMMAEIKGDLAALNIKHDIFFSERSLIEARIIASPQPSTIPL